MKRFLIQQLIVLIYCLASIWCFAQKSTSAYISGIISDANPGDSLRVVIQNKLFLPYGSSKIPPETFYREMKNGKFFFQFKNISEPTYITLLTFGKKKEILLGNYLIMPADSVSMKIEEFNISFSGNGFSKYNCKYELDLLYRRIQDSLVRAKPQGSVLEEVEFWYRSAALIRESLVEKLIMYKDKLDPVIFQIMFADIYGKTQFTPINFAGIQIVVNRRIKDSSDKARISLYGAQYLKELREIPQEILAMSMDYLKFLFKNGNLQKSLTNKSYYTAFKENYSGLLREKLLTTTIVEAYSISKDADSIINDVLSVVHTQPYRKIISEIHEPRRKGAQAYQFSLPNAEGKIVRLNDFKGKVIFLDYWTIGCHPCAWYYKDAVSKAQEYFRSNQDIVFISINLDEKKEQWVRGIKSGLYTSEDAINLFTNGSAFKHLAARHYGISAVPVPILIGRDGKIFTANATELGHGIKSSSEKLIFIIKQALERDYTSREATPSQY